MRLAMLFVATLIHFCYALPSTQRPTGSPASPCNEETEFDCEYEESGKRKCIPIEWMCDNVVDCHRNSKDEAMCRYLHFCLSDMLTCRNGVCVDASFKCNGFDDCGDGTDERGCEKLEKKPEPPKGCKQGFFRCRNGPCITVQAKCDRVEDCPEGDDEVGCPEVKANETVSCAEHQFMCDNTCIPRIWKCDGVADCMDGTDEVKAVCEVEEDDDLLAALPSRDEYHSHVVNQSLCSANEFLCEPGVCITRGKLCDTKRDCPKGNDEGGLCGECASFGCSHHCTDTPDGAICSCREGEKLAMNGRTCEDVDECATVEGHVCSHKCVNVQRDFHCACYPGYLLSTDGHSCHAEADSYSSIFLSLGIEVRHMPPYSTGSLVGYGVYQRNEKVGTMIRSIAFNPTLNRLFMGVTNVEHQGQLHSAANGVQHCYVDNVIGVSNIAVDWLTNNLYYTAQYPSELPGVSVCLWDGRFCRLLVSGLTDGEYYKRQAYRGLVVDPERANMFWVDVPGSVGSSKIMFSSMDGSDVRALVMSKLEHPQGLAMDFVRQKLYFSDIELQLIERVDVVTRERTTVTSRGVHHPFELAFFDDYIYWSDWNTEAVLAVRVGSDDLPHVAHSLDRMPYGLAVNHSSFWNTQLTNPCEAMECRLCVLRNVNGKVAGKCICPNLYKQIASECVAMNASEVVALGFKQKLPSMSTATMAMYCEAGEACLNGGVCEREVNSHGHVDNITCSCPHGYSGMYCDVVEPYSVRSLSTGMSVWLFIWLLFCVFILVGSATYLLVTRCPVVREFVDNLLDWWVLRALFGRSDEQEVVVKQPTLAFDADGFENPTYGSPQAELDGSALPHDASPYAFNETVPIAPSGMSRRESSPRFTAGC